MKYEVLRRGTADELVEAVNAYLNTGWEPLGGVTGIHCNADEQWPAEFIWCQAVVKRHPVDPL